jgi:hypothetical protein
MLCITCQAVGDTMREANTDKDELKTYLKLSNHLSINP